MFQDYLINVVMTALPMWTFASIMFVLGLIYVRNKSFGEFWYPIKICAGMLMIAGLIIGMNSRVNTYKNTVDYNRIQDIQRIEQVREAQGQRVIEDRTRKPLVAEELAEKSIDMRSRVTLNHDEESNQSN